jgi:hypothetical protein
VGVGITNSLNQGKLEKKSNIMIGIMEYGDGDGSGSTARKWLPGMKILTSLDFGSSNIMLINILGYFGSLKSPYGPESIVPDAQQSLDKEPDASSSTNSNPLQSDPLRYSHKGAIYYDMRLQRNFRRDSDSTGELTNEAAKDTLRNLD